MRDFFKGWRRKIGCALLLVSVALLALWSRSFYEGHAHQFNFRGEQYILLTSIGGVSLSRVDWMPLPWNAEGVLGTHLVPLWRVAYLPVIAPLTLLSGALILWPRSNRPIEKQQNERGDDDGADNQRQRQIGK